MMDSGTLTAQELVEFYIERMNGHVRGALHEVPLLVKDNIDTACGMKKLRYSGAIILEKQI